MEVNLSKCITGCGQASRKTKSIMPTVLLLSLSLFVGNINAQTYTFSNNGKSNFQGDVVVDSPARVGIGTASPGTALDVSGTISATGGDSTQWNEAYSWGNHADAGYAMSTGSSAPLFDAVVAPSGGDYTTIQAALNDNKKTIFVRNGTYTLAADIVIDEDNVAIIGESCGGVILDANGNDHSIKIDTTGLSNILEGGTISISTASAIVTGSGTSFTSDVSAGDYILIKNNWHVVDSVQNNTQLTLVTAYQGKTLNGETYRIGKFIEDICLKNLTLIDYSLGTAGETGPIDFSYVLNGRIENCVIDNAGDAKSGIKLTGCAYAKVTGNTVTNTHQTGIFLVDTSFTDVLNNRCTNSLNEGIKVQDSSFNTFNGNICANNGENGFTFTGTTNHNRICKNDASNNDLTGIDFGGTEANRNIISDNNCEANDEFGIALGNVTQSTVTGNSCSENSRDGIILSSTDDSVVTGNSCHENLDYGIRVLSSTDNVVGMNILQNNTDGPGFIQSSSNTKQTVTNWGSF